MVRNKAEIAYMVSNKAEIAFNVRNKVETAYKVVIKAETAYMVSNKTETVYNVRQKDQTHCKHVPVITRKPNLRKERVILRRKLSKHPQLLFTIGHSQNGSMH